MRRAHLAAVGAMMLLFAVDGGRPTTAEEAIILPIERISARIVTIVLPLRRQVQPLKGTARVITAEKAEMRAALSELKAQRTKKGELKLNLAADILFAFDSARIRPRAAHALSQVALVIRETRPARVRIEGHTDAKGSDAYNLRLSLRRAQAVRDWLQRRERITAVTMHVKGFGERRPVAPNAHPDGSDDPDGRRLNRHVEIFLVPRQDVRP